VRFIRIIRVAHKMKKILVVEDDLFISEMYVNKLRGEGFEVFLAKDGQEAVDKTKELKPDLVLLDIVLPKKDGFEALKEIKNSDEAKETKVILLTNLGQPEDIKKGMETKADAYIVKAHSTPSQIVEKVKEFLEN
jgi:DNA-binding response OmpR family regulator